MPESLLFEVETPLEFRVRVTEAYWQIIITVKHPSMQNRESDVQTALKKPDEIRQSLNDENVYLFYKMETVKRWICVVAKKLDGDGFLITTYLTDAIKEGEVIWKK